MFHHKLLLPDRKFVKHATHLAESVKRSLFATNDKSKYLKFNTKIKTTWVYSGNRWWLMINYWKKIENFHSSPCDVRCGCIFWKVIKQHWEIPFSFHGIHPMDPHHSPLSDSKHKLIEMNSLLFIIINISEWDSMTLGSILPFHLRSFNL